MPFIRPKKLDPSALSWDAFPPPPPEAETWQPDPDWIARPGDLPDPRFNRDPEVSRRGSATKSKLGYSVSSSPSLSPSVGNAAPAVRGLGQWPAPSPRATGYPRDLVRNTSPPTPAMAPVESNPLTAKPAKSVIAGPTKGTMESLPTHHRPQTPITSTASLKTASPTKSIPAWAAPLEKALAEDTAKDQPRLETTRKASVPPHLRSKGNIVHERKLDAAANSYDSMSIPIINQEDELSDQDLAWKVTTTDIGAENAKEGLQLQAEILKRYTPQERTRLSDDRAHADHRRKISYVHKLKVMLIRAMEAELDLSKVATERDLLAMTGEEIDKYDDKVRSAHKHWYEAQQRS